MAWNGLDKRQFSSVVIERIEDLLIQQLVHCPAGDCKAICREGRRLQLKLSTNPFCIGLPRTM